MSIKKLTLLVLPLVATFSLHAANPFNDPFFNDPFGDDIFKEMLQMQKDMDKMFKRMQERRQQRSSGLLSPLGVYKMSAQNQFVDKGDFYELVTNIPESKESHIDINTVNNIMSISAKIIHKQEQKTGNMHSISSSVRMYQQSTALPNNVDESNIKTIYRNGKLIITIDKKNIVKVTPVVKKTEVKKVEVQKPEAKRSETKKPDMKNDVSTQNRVEITDEFNQTPETTKKEEIKSSINESNSTIKKTVPSDVKSMY